jgi:hypothetical protein
MGADLTFKQIVDLVSGFGIPGIILIIWYFSEKAHDKTLKNYREDIHRTLVQYHEEMIEQRRMYENNVELVKRFIELSGDLKDIVVLNTQMLTGVKDDINKNQFCPAVRLKKQASGVQV